MDKYLNQIICGDCRELLKDVPKVDFILTDPPYGIDYKSQNRPNEIDYKKIENDSTEMNLDFLFQREEIKIIFGANNFYKQLPHKGIWICWDKRMIENPNSILGSAFELAWCSKTNGFYKIYRVMHGGVINNDNPNQKRFHPTQKPIELFMQILNDFTKEGDIILDPFIGSGTTALACKRMNRNFIGIDIDEEYCEIARTRLKQGSMF